ncbi:MAG: RagB/SusD family nutrient uptake outer membrane protein [Dysgonamonadaceae bacterium]|nr:RagB/SusD family nutrient uptake outer membrane protein [Dysgonamonadaceae bacterium]
MNIIKKISIASMLFVMLLGFNSCNDWLDLEPSNRPINETGSPVTSLNEANARLNALYAMLRSYYLYGARMTYYGDALSEDMQANGSTKRTSSYYQFSITKDNAPSTFWTNYYEIINNVNALLTGIDAVPVFTEADILTRNDYKGQALTVRALAYFDLTRLYGYPYQKDNGASLGVPIRDENPVNPDYKPTRSTVAQCYEYFIKDLADAVALLKSDKNNGRFNKWAAMQLLSRAYLYKGDDTNALATAKEAVAGAEAKGYKLWTASEYTAASAWSAEFGTESLWELPIMTGETAGGNENIGYLVYASGYDDIVLSDDWTVKLMGDQTDDARYKCIINVTSSGKAGRRYLWKYSRQSGESNYGYGNVRVLRLSELYLIAAEAAARLGNQNADAVKYLDPIAKRGLETNTVEGTTVTLDRVLQERRKELVGEGHRFFDAIRNHKHITRSQGLTFPHLPTIQQEGWDFDWSYYKVALPIPKSEMDSNSSLKDQQNPGY